MVIKRLSGIGLYSIAMWYFFCHCLSYCLFSFDHWIVCLSSNLRHLITPLISSNV